MIFIKSKDNETYKKIKSLSTSKGRKKEGKYIAEGIRTVELAVEYGAEIDVIAMSEKFYTKIENKTIVDNLDEKFKVYVFPDDMFEKMVMTENTQGVAAICKIRSLNVEDFNCYKHKKIIVVDRIQDPGNMGTIIRTADAAGFDLILITSNTVDVFNPKVVRSAMGSMFFMDMIFASQNDLLECLKKNDIEIVSGYLNTDNYYDKIEYKEKCALVVGNEANGINEFWIENSDKLVKIPMFGRAESLNVAVSAALLMYQINKK